MNGTTERTLRQAAAFGARWGRRAGIFPHRPERWTHQRWESSYESGDLGHFSSFEEVPRYGVVAGYVMFGGGRPDVVDLGCGPGLLLLYLHPSRFGRYLGVDSSTAAIERALRLRDERADFVVGDVHGVALPDCDVVVLNELLYYLPQPEVLLGRITTCLRPGGRIVTSMWRHPGDRQLWRVLDERFDRLDVADVSSRANSRARRGWWVACHRLRPA